MIIEGERQTQGGITAALAAMVLLGVTVLSASVGTQVAPDPLENVPPVASCSAPDHTKVGETVRMDASASWDPDRTGRWTSVAPMSGERRGLAVVAEQGKLYAFGGGLRGTPLNRSEAYDPSTDMWEPRTSMPTSRDGVEAAIMDGGVHVLGGVNYDTMPPTGRDEHEVYDSLSDEWGVRARLPEAGRISVDAPGGTLYALALFTGHVYAYNSSADSWSPRAPFPGPAIPVAWRAVGDRLIVAGGLYPTQVGDTWAWDPTWVERARA